MSNAERNFFSEDILSVIDKVHREPKKAYNETFLPLFPNQNAFREFLQYFKDPHLIHSFAESRIQSYTIYQLQSVQDRRDNAHFFPSILLLTQAHALRNIFHYNIRRRQNLSWTGSLLTARMAIACVSGVLRF